MRNSDRSGSAHASVLPLAVRLLVFCLPLAGGWAALEYVIAKVPNSQTLKRDGLASAANEVDTLVLGSSEAYYGIVPQRLSGSAFSLANSSQSLYYDDQLVTKVGLSLPRLKRVLVTISYFSLYFQLHDSDESWRQYSYLQEWHIPPPQTKDAFDLRRWSRVALYGPRVTLDALRRGRGATLAPEVDERGWYRVPETVRYGLEPEAARAPLALHHGFMHPAHEAANIASLEHLLGLLRQRNVEVVLVTTPVWPTYAAGMNAASWEHTNGILELLGRKYGARRLSFLREPRLGPEDFLDCDHLNARGAIRFTELLDVALRDPATSSGRPSEEDARHRAAAVSSRP